MNISVPRDGRPQWDPATIMMANASLGRWPLTAGVETVTPGGSYILANSWPAPARTSFSGPTAVSTIVDTPPDAVASKTAARPLWPNLR